MAGKVRFQEPDPAHQQALLEQKRKAYAAPSDRLSVAVPESEAFLQAALLRGESVVRQTRISRNSVAPKPLSWLE